MSYLQRRGEWSVKEGLFTGRSGCRRVTGWSSVDVPVLSGDSSRQAVEDGEGSIRATGTQFVIAPLEFVGELIHGSGEQVNVLAQLVEGVAEVGQFVRARTLPGHGPTPFEGEQGIVKVQIER